MDPIDNKHRKPHERRIEDIQIHLMRNDIPVQPLNKLDNPNDRPDEDEDVDNIEAVPKPIGSVPEHLLEDEREGLTYVSSKDTPSKWPSVPSTVCNGKYSPRSQTTQKIQSAQKVPKQQYLSPYLEILLR